MFHLSGFRIAVVGIYGQSVSLLWQYVFFIILVKNEPLTKQIGFWFSVIPSVHGNTLAYGIYSEQRVESQMSERPKYGRIRCSCTFTKSASFILAQRGVLLVKSAFVQSESN